MTAITDAGSAEMTMLEVVCSAMALRALPRWWNRGSPGLASVTDPRADLVEEPRGCAVASPCHTGASGKTRVRQFETPRTYALPPRGNLTDDVVRNGTEHAGSVAFSVGRDGVWYDVTAAEFLAQVRAVARGLVAAGVGVGDRVALCSRTRYEWTLLDYAIWFAGAVSVPIYETSSAEQMQWILSDSGASAVVVEGDAHLRMVEELRDRVPLRQVWCLGHGDVDELCRRGQEVPRE